jgi:hypothetical protein
MNNQTTASPDGYSWKRFWSPRDGILNLHHDGYLADPDGRFGRHWNADLRTFEEIAALPCLALLGEPTIAKTTAIRMEWEKVEARVGAGSDGQSFGHGSTPPYRCH